MRKCISIQGLLLVLLVLTSISIALQPDIPENSKSVSINPQYSINSVLIDTSTSNITWTSRTQQTSQIIENNSIATGDHVIVNGTFSPSLNITECNLTIWNPQTGINASVSSFGSSIIYDTYYLDRINQTYHIIVNGTTNTNDSVIILRENVTICNFFAPEFNSYPLVVNTIDTVFNISWSSMDLNQDDENYYSIWLSNNGGLSYMLLQQNLTQTWFLWDSGAWLAGEFFVKVRGYSVDYSSEKCRVDDPPLGYWPGDWGESFSISFYAGPDGWWPAGIRISHNKLTYLFGSTDNEVTVYVTFPANRPPPPAEPMIYSVSENGVIWLEGLFDPMEDSFKINIDGLSIGVHNLSICTIYFGPDEQESLKVTVIEQISTSSPSIPSMHVDSFLPGLLAGISIGSIVIIALVIVLSRQLKRVQVIEYV